MRGGIEGNRSAGKGVNEREGDARGEKGKVGKGNEIEEMKGKDAHLIYFPHPPHEFIHSRPLYNVHIVYYIVYCDRYDVVRAIHGL
jgi:hypothetical protein